MINQQALLPLQLAPWFQQILDHCSHTYPGSEPPVCKEWNKPLAEALRFIYTYKNEGDPTQAIPRHWHYVGFGLSDIHGFKERNRMQKFLIEAKLAPEATEIADFYPRPDDLTTNGFGFELTFRLKCNSDDEWNAEPPTWPNKILQNLAHYVFSTRDTFSVGEIYEWNEPIDGQSSRISHFFMMLDLQLRHFKPIDTQVGPVTFIQLVGACEEEFQKAREWAVGGILKIMQEKEETGGKLLVTDVRRKTSIFELDPNNVARVEEGINAIGSTMVKLTAKLKYAYRKPSWFRDVEHQETEADNLISATDDDMAPDEEYQMRSISRMSQASESSQMRMLENREICQTRVYKNIYLLLTKKSASVLPVMLKRVLANGRTFHFQSFKGDSTITFVPKGQECEPFVFVSAEKRFAKTASWLQIYISDELREQIYESVKNDFPNTNGSYSDDSDRESKLPKNYSWPDYNLYLTVVEDIRDTTIAS